MTVSNYYTPSSPVGDLLQSEYHQISVFDLNIGQTTPKNQISFPTKLLHDENEPFRNIGVTSEVPSSPKHIGLQTIMSQPEGRSPSQQWKITPSSLDNHPYSPSSLPESNLKTFGSPRSVTSISSGATSYASSRRSSDSYRFDDPTFAPPPLRPKTDTISESTSSHNNKFSSILSKFDKITHSGHMQARTSLKALLTKKWKSMFWITYNNSEVYIFRSKVDFEEWATNPYLSTTEREEIVKLKIDFKLGSESNVGVRFFRAFALESKSYGKSGMMYTFKLEQWMRVGGPMVVGAFASTSESEVGAFYILCKEMMHMHKSAMSNFVKK